jgi:NAD(P)-dependent dehydrogenase (short-subunit alcohol dehydrogenase family)
MQFGRRFRRSPSRPRSRKCGWDRAYHGEVEDTSQAALYLATAGFVTGTTLFVDGGYAHGR